MRSTHRFSLPVLVAAATALFPLLVFAADAEQRAARIVTTARAIEWHPAIDPAATAATLLSVQRPDGEVITETFAAGRNPMLQLGGLADGLYAYELRIPQASSAPLVQSGSFTVANGAIVSPHAVEHTLMDRHLRPTVETLFTDCLRSGRRLCRCRLHRHGDFRPRNGQGEGEQHPLQVRGHLDVRRLPDYGLAAKRERHLQRRREQVLRRRPHRRHRSAADRRRHADQRALPRQHRPDRNGNIDSRQEPLDQRSGLSDHPHGAERVTIPGVGRRGE